MSPTDPPRGIERRTSISDRRAGDRAERDERAIAALREAASIDAPSVFDTARAARRLEAALDADAGSSWTSSRVALVAGLASFAGAAAVGLLLWTPVGSEAEAAGGVDGSASLAWTQPSVPLALPSVEAAPLSIEPLPRPAEPRRSRVPAASEPPRRPADLARAAPASVEALREITPAPRVVPSWRGEVERLVEGGDTIAAARLLVQATPSDDAAATALGLLARRFPAAYEAVADELSRLTGPEAMRVRCEQQLLLARDRVAVEACRAFGQSHPEHPAARVLSFAAGRVAEDLGELRWAEEEYSRSLLLAPFSGLSGTDALLARARVRAAAGDVDEARADLRLFLFSEPAGRGDPAVAQLAAELELDERAPRAR